MKNNFIVPLAIDFASLLAICILFRYNIALLFALGGILLFCLRIWQDPFYKKLAIFALLFGALGEWACCKLQLWIYVNPTWQGLPLWLPLIWPILMLSFWRISLVADKALDRYKKIAWFIKLVGWISVVAYAGFSLFTINKNIAVVYAVFSLAMIIWGRSQQFLLYFLISSVGGSFGEIICMRFGVWYYTNPWFKTLGIPLSLPLAWGLSAVVISLIAGGHTNKFSNKPLMLE